MDTMKKADGLQWDGRSEVHAEKPVQVFIIRGKLRSWRVLNNACVVNCGRESISYFSARMIQYF